MKYFIDTEFIEGFHKPLFGKRRHFIDLISIGIYCEDGRSYYALSNEFNPKDADKWVQENVLDKIEIEYHQKESTYAKTYHWECLNLKNFMKWYGKSNKQIAEEILQFVYPDVYKNFKGSEKEFYSRTKQYGWNTDTPIEFYGYYADYDWVVFCSLFGRMIDLPKEFPMYCIDLKQEFDMDYHVAIRERMKQHKDYPQQTNQHNALADAKWNFELYKFLNNL